MAGFVAVSVVGSRRSAGVVCRVLPGGWVWARRALPAGAGWSPAPSCLFVPFASECSASAFARAVFGFGWRVWVRTGSAGSPVFEACGLSIPAFAVKVAPPAGWSTSAARVVLFGLAVAARPLPQFSRG
jgi:hypothetical protein